MAFRIFFLLTSALAVFACDRPKPSPIVDPEKQQKIDFLEISLHEIPPQLLPDQPLPTSADVIPETVPVQPGPAPVKPVLVTPVPARIESDYLIKQQIRQELTNDKTLSFQAKNVQILVERGVVALSGLVGNLDERRRVEFIAESIPGVVRVVNKTEIMNAPIQNYL